jgi:hypothetical protein
VVKKTKTKGPVTKSAAPIASLNGNASPDEVPVLPDADIGVDDDDGWEVPRRTARIVFEDGEYDGAIVKTALDGSLNVYLDYVQLTEKNSPAEVAEAVRRFGDELLIEWNVKVNGHPIEPTGEGMCQIPMPFAILILQTWMKAMAEPSGPLEESTSDGGTSAEGKTETET